MPSKILVCAKLKNGEWIKEPFSQNGILQALERIAEIESRHINDIITAFISYRGRKIYETDVDKVKEELV